MTSPAAATSRIDPSSSAAPGGLEPPSVLVLTKDEEVNIDACLESLSFSDDIVVLDSFSTDRTVELARRHPNVRVVERKLDTWSNHSNWAMENIEFKHPWVYYSDADERVTPALRDQILGVINDPANEHNAFRLRYKNMFMGQWIRHGGLYPVWIIRLFRPDKIHYEDREVNAHPIVDGSIGELSEHFIHYSFNKGLLPWFYKHNSYSQMESHEALKVRGNSSFGDHLRGAFDSDKLVRRRAIKNLSFYPPFRGFVRFFYMYFLRLGFLDWRAGFHYCTMVAMYEYWIDIKTREREKSWQERNEQVVHEMLAEPSA